MSSYSPLRYPGGKAKLAPYVIELIKLNNLSEQHYVEPYVGGAGVALELLLGEWVRHIHINDLDRNIYAFWHSVLFECEGLCRLISDTEINLDAWRGAKVARENSTNEQLLQLGFSTFFLNRTNRSGVLNAGVIGGNNQSGKWKIDCRFNKKILIEKIQRIALNVDRISLYSRDGKAFVSSLPDTVKANSLIYMDPPYFKKGAFLYKNHFKTEDHQDLAAAVSEIEGHNWCVSYDNVAEIRNMYAGVRNEEFDIDYTANGFSRGKEIMFFGPDLILPKKIWLSGQKKHRV